MGWQAPRVSGLIFLAVAASVGRPSDAGATDLGPPTGQHVGKVIAWDRSTDRLVLVEAGTGNPKRRITLWTEPQTTLTDLRSSSQDLFGYERSRGHMSLADLHPGDHVEIEWRRAGKKHVAVSVRRFL